MRRVVGIVSMADRAEISRLLAVRAPEPTTIDLRHMSVAERELVGEVMQVVCDGAIKVSKGWLSEETECGIPSGLTVWRVFPLGPAGDAYKF